MSFKKSTVENERREIYRHSLILVSKETNETLLRHCRLPTFLCLRRGDCVGGGGGGTMVVVRL